MKSLSTLVFVLFLATMANAQPVLTLGECYEGAEGNYPLARQRALIERTTSFTIENVLKANFPQVSIGGQATYQSEVIQIPVEMPGVEPLSNDQYKIFGEIAHTIYQGGLITEQKKSTKVNGEVEEKRLEVDLYQVRERINNLFFGILLLREQASVSALARRDLSAGLKKAEAAIANGTAIPSAADALRAELLKIDQRIVEMQSAEDAYRQVLGSFIGRPISEAVLKRPEFLSVPDSINRPELALFTLQRKSIQSNVEVITAERKPRVQLFVQGGYGRPGLNMLENEFEFYYMGGIRLRWMLSGYYTLKRERQILALRQQSLDVQEETFLFNTRLKAQQHQAEIAKFERLIEIDNQIIDLRKGIRKAAAVQLEEGVISSTDFIREVIAEDQAKQNRALHETQLLMVQAEYHFTLGQQLNSHQ